MTRWLPRGVVCAVLCGALGQGCVTLPAPPIENERPRRKRPVVVAPEKPPEPEKPSEAPTEPAIEPPRTAEPSPLTQVEEGLASYYSDKLKGRRMASGMRYNPKLATCAHRTHPFGTKLTITALATGRETTCRVEDRGPYVQGRVVDLSKRVAQRLGILGKGVVKVRVVPTGTGAS